MLVPQVSDDLDGIEPGVLSEREGDDLQGVGEGLDAALLGAVQSPGILGELLGELDFDGTATWNDAVVLDKAPHNTEGVVEGSLGLVDDLGQW